MNADDLGGVEAAFYWASTTGDLTDRDPSLEVVAIPVDVDEEALVVQGGLLRMQILKTKINDNDLDQATFGRCTGYITVYPGYVSKRQEPPSSNIRTYTCDWCVIYRDEKYYYISASVRDYVLGEDLQFFWGRFS